MTVAKVEFTGLEIQRRRLRSSLNQRIGKVLDHGKFIMGPEVGELENSLVAFCGAKHAISVANGTDAIQIALMTLGVGYGDAVMVPSFTYTATAEVILVLGAKPVFVEVSPQSFNIDCDLLPAALDEARKAGLRPRAIIGVDLFGLPADWETLNAFVKREGLFLIADAAQSFGAKSAAGKAVGTLAPITTTSFFPAKPLGCYGDGGAIFTDDDNLAMIMRSIRVHGQGAEKYETARVGLNSRLDTMQAAVLLAKLECFAEEIVSRNNLAERYETRLANRLITPRKPHGVTSAWAQYTIRSDRRDALQRHLSAYKIPTAIYYPKPMHLQLAYGAYSNGFGSLPISEALSQQVLSLPMNPYFDDHDVESVCSAIEAFI